MEFSEIINIVMLVAIIIGTAGSYFGLRGRSFGLPDMLVFVPLAGAADWLSWQLYQIATNSHGESAAYGGLLALLSLFGVVPVAIALSIIAGAAVMICIIRYPTVRYGTLGLLLMLWLVHQRSGFIGSAQEPGALLNNDRLAGESWALESGATSQEDCDRQSHAQAFRAACYSRLGR